MVVSAMHLSVSTRSTRVKKISDVVDRVWKHSSGRDLHMRMKSSKYWKMCCHMTIPSWASASAVRMIGAECRPNGIEFC